MEQKNPLIFDIDLDRDAKIFASFGHRFFASLIDLVVVVVPLTCLHFYNLLFLKSFFIHFLILMLHFCFKTLMEYKFGATIGKLIMKIKAVDLKFNPITFVQALKRNIMLILSNGLTFIYGVLVFQRTEMGYLDAFIQINELNAEAFTTFALTLIHLSYIVSCICVIITPRQQSLHDLFGNTYIIKKDAPLDLIRKPAKIGAHFL